MVRSPLDDERRIVPGKSLILIGPDRYSDDDEPKRVAFRDPARSLLPVGEHRKHGKPPFAGRQG